MLSRTITILPAFLMIILGIVVGFAVLGLRGPQRELRDARHAIQRADYTTALRHLNRVKNEIDINDTALQEQATRMRAQAYEQLGDRPKAIEDLRFLIDDLQINSSALFRDRIRLLNETGAVGKDVNALNQALKYSKRWLSNNQDDSQVMGQAGHSRQILASIELDKWISTFDKQLPTEHRQRITDLIKQAVYSTSPTQTLAIDLGQLSAEVDAFAPGFSSHFHPNVERIQKIAEQARNWFLKSLSSPESDFAAYDGIATQLRAARDDDTLLMLAHVHLSRAKLHESFSAAFDIADIHLRHKRYQATIEIAKRVLPIEHITPRFYDGTINRDAIRLLTCQAIATAQIGDRKARNKIMHAVGKIAYKKRPPHPQAEESPYALTHFILGILIDDKPSVAAHLGGFTTRLKDHAWFRERLASYAFEALARAVSSDDQEALYQRWIKFDPSASQPVHAYAKLLLSHGKTSEANRQLVGAVAKLPDADESLELLVKTQLRTSGADLQAVATNLTQLGRIVPDDTGAFPAITIALARHALDSGLNEIAVGCAMRAKTLFPRCKIPHYLHAHAMLASNEPEQAERVIQRLLDEFPNDHGALQILTTARRQAGQATDDLLFAAILNGTPDLQSNRYLANRWLMRGEYQRVINLASATTSTFGIDLEMQARATQALMLSKTSNRSRVLTMLRAVFHLSRGIQNPTPQQEQLAAWALGQYILFNPENLDFEIRRGLLTEFLAANQSAENLDKVAVQLSANRDFELALRCYRDLTQDDRYKDFRQGQHFITAAHIALRLDDTTKAREMLAAAMAFPDGTQANIDLLLLDLAHGKATVVPDNLVVQDLLTTSLVMRNSPTEAIPFLIKELKANPNQLESQCLAAIISDKAVVSPHVQTLATSNPAELLTLISLLESPPFGHLAIHFARALVQSNQGNPVAQLLLAKAHSNANQPLELQQAFDKIRNEISQDMVLMMAALDILGQANHPALQHSKVKDQLAAIALKNGANTPPALLAMVLRQNASILQVPGSRNRILPMVKGFWLTYPQLSGAGLAEARMLLDAGNHHDALALLRRIEKKLPASQRSDYLVTYYEIVSILAESATPKSRNELIQEALGRLKTGTVHGAPLHFVLRWLDRVLLSLKGTPEGEKVRTDLLTIEGLYLGRHIAECPALSKTDMYFLQMSLERLGAKRGYSPAMQAVDDLLRRDPSLVPIWRLRARWLVRLNRVTEATQSLMWIPQYIKSPEVLDILIQLLARSGQLVEKGKTLLSMNSLSNASKLSLGLTELRLARYQHAIKTLESASPQPDGAHLYYRSLSLLSLPVPEALDQAKVALTKLVRDYGGSSFAASAAAILAVL
jgi:tetratricopeptide (TPR) repeat protein